jgi:hypothetical protein
LNTKVVILFLLNPGEGTHLISASNFMSALKHYEGPFPVESVMKLAEVERVLRKLKLIHPLPCRRTFVHWIQDGTLDGFLTPKGYYVVTVASFERLVKMFSGAAPASAERRF